MKKSSRKAISRLHRLIMIKDNSYYYRIQGTSVSFISHIDGEGFEVELKEVEQLICVIKEERYKAMIHELTSR